MGYILFNLTQNGDYIYIRTNTFATDSFSFGFTGDFAGGKVSCQRAFTKQDGTIGLEHKHHFTPRPLYYDAANGTDGGSLSATKESNWYIFELTGVTGTANIIMTINNIIFPGENTKSNLNYQIIWVKLEMK